MGISTALVVMMILFTWFKFKNYKIEKEPTGFSKILANKWYVDELYNKAVVSPLSSLAAFFNKSVEPKVIDGTVNGVGKAVNYASRQIRWIQSGQVGAYILLMVIGMIILFFIQLFL